MLLLQITERILCPPPRISENSPLEQAICNALDLVPRAQSYLDHDHPELDNTAAEQALEPISIGRDNWMFVGSEGGGRAMAIAFTLIEAAKQNSVDPQSWMRWGLRRIADNTTQRSDETMPWSYAAQAGQARLTT
ncbi:transposase [Tropicimonas sp. TH_r6]|uniref:IS66 family transposase n=1 Tax=Tropicimonas sp. TH_r6 TaxID=3082085 RepID=UPI0029557888|nr:transposase [Tropicimonas sp. TH_r6]MDV7144859.1 transposase [Tropicimonas sp. TH_r6]